MLPDFGSPAPPAGLATLTIGLVRRGGGEGGQVARERGRGAAVNMAKWAPSDWADRSPPWAAQNGGAGRWRHLRQIRSWPRRQSEGRTSRTGGRRWNRAGQRLSGRPLTRRVVVAMIKRRAVPAVNVLSHVPGRRG